MNTFRIVSLHDTPIYDQLLLEEALLRSSDENWCLINTGSSPAIVLGISGKKEELVDHLAAQEKGIPLIKRFSGGGTVIVDENTLFVTFISQKQIHSFPAYPEPIMKWTEEIYREVFTHPTFALKENDYVFAERKFGGNAQYIKKDRWLHHTSFLWDYAPERMQLLLHPKKTPNYRKERSHEEFLCKLHEHFANKQEFTKSLLNALQKRFILQETTPEEAWALLPKDSRRSTQFIS